MGDLLSEAGFDEGIDLGLLTPSDARGLTEEEVELRPLLMQCIKLASGYVDGWAKGMVLGSRGGRNTGAPSGSSVQAVHGLALASPAGDTRLASPPRAETGARGSAEAEGRVGTSSCGSARASRLLLSFARSSRRCPLRKQIKPAPPRPGSLAEEDASRILLAQKKIHLVFNRFSRSANDF